MNPVFLMLTQFANKKLNKIFAILQEPTDEELNHIKSSYMSAYKANDKLSMDIVSN